MVRRRRTRAWGRGPVAPLAIGVLVVVGACGDDHGSARPPEASPTSGRGAADGGSSRSGGAPPGSETSPGSDPAGAGGTAGPLVGADGAFLAGPGPRDRRLGADQGCAALADPETTTDCGVTEMSPGLSVVWQTVEGADRWRVSLWVREDDRLRGALAWQGAMDAVTGVVVRTGDLDRDSGDELVVGYRSAGTAGFLDLDVVAADAGGGGGGPEVMIHRSLDKGMARLAGGVLETRRAQFGPEDPNCCPSTFVAETIDRVAGAWRITGSETVEAGAAFDDQFA